MQTHSHNDPELAHFDWAYLTNGMIGLRPPPHGLPSGRCLISGFCDVTRHNGSDSLVPAPYPLGFSLAVNGRFLSDPACWHLVEQRHDYSCGELTTILHAQLDDLLIELELLAFCSRSRPMLCVQEATVRSNADCELILQAFIDEQQLPDNPDRLPGRRIAHAMPRIDDCDFFLHWAGDGGLGHCGIASLARLVEGAAVETWRSDTGFREPMCAREFRIAARAGDRYRLRQVAAMVGDAVHPEPHLEACRHLREAGYADGHARLRDENRRVWSELWSRRILVDCDDPDWQPLLDACFYYSQAGASAAKPFAFEGLGLAHAQPYSGRCFWDTDSYAFPATLAIQPGVARSYLAYRAMHREQARLHAATRGQAGLCYPWNSQRSGHEMVSWFFKALDEQHVTLQVAFAALQYDWLHDDDIIRREEIWPIVNGVADWIVSRVTTSERGYELRCMTGISEGHHNKDNNVFVNLHAQTILREAVDLAARVGLQPRPDWQRVAEGLVIPMHAGVLWRYDGYQTGVDAAHPEPLAALFPYRHRGIDAETWQRSIRYYLGESDPYTGPMLSQYYPVWACRLGDRAAAREWCRRGCADFAIGPFLNVCEVIGKRSTTYYPATFHSMLIAHLFGFTGLEPDAGPIQGWARHPIVLPDGWRSVQAKNLQMRDSLVDLQAEHGAERCRIRVH